MWVLSPPKYNMGLASVGGRERRYLFLAGDRDGFSLNGNPLGLCFNELPH